MVHTLTAPEQVKKCLHCDTPIGRSKTRDFCCHGCETAYNFIKKHSLDEYYLRRDDQKIISLQDLNHQNYDFLDHDDVRKLISTKTSDGIVAHVFIDRISCYACVWVCEKAIKKADLKAEIRINMNSQQAQIYFEPSECKLSEVATVLDQLGYPVSLDTNHAKNNKSQLLRLGVAFFCLMNIMLLSSAEYLGSDLEDSVFFHIFRYISMGLATLDLLFAATPFYSNTLRAIRKGHLHLDLPISLALLSSYLFSSYNTLLGEGHVYFDSMVAIIFLLLLGRFMQDYSLKKNLQSQQLRKRTDHWVRFKKSEGLWDWKESKNIAPGDRLKLLPGDLVPVKCRLESDRARISEGLMTGESDEKDKAMGQTIDSGSSNIDSLIEVTSLEEGSQSKLFQIEAESQRILDEKGSMSVLSQKLAHFLILFVLSVCSIVLFVMPFEQSFPRAIAILLVACPCAFGLATPLILARSLNLGWKKGIIFRSLKAIETLPNCKNFYFDKTGTLTVPDRQAQLIMIDESLGSLRELAQTTLTIRSESNHHWSLALSQWALGEVQTSNLKIANFKESFGQGISFSIGENVFRCGKKSFVECESFIKHGTFISKNNKLWAVFDLSEGAANGAIELVHKLQEEDYNTMIYSGDSEEKVNEFISKYHLQGLSYQAKMLPEDKLDMIGHERSVMVGNGINDAMAMAKSDLSIAVLNSTEQACKASDISLTTDNLMSVFSAIKITKLARKSLKRCFIFAFLFNISAISLGVLGFLTPVAAALLMPLSTLTVIALSSRWREN